MLLLGFRDKVPDDRARTVTLLGTQRWGGAPRGTNAAAVALLKQLGDIDYQECVENAKVLGKGETVVVWIVAAVGLATIVALHSTSLWPSNWILAKLAVVGVVLALAIPAVFIARMFGITFQSSSNARIVQALTYHALCPGCGTSLGNLRVESDGCVSCSQCNAAWRADRFGPPEKRVKTPGTA